MVCSFAVLQFLGCRHNRLVKIGCSNDCTDFCEPQETLLFTQSRFTCISCTKAKEDAATVKSMDELQAALAAVDESTAAIQDPQLQQSIRACLYYNTHARCGFLFCIASNKRALEISETEDLEDWTVEYANKLWHMKHGSSKDVEDNRRDLDRLLAVQPWELRIVKEDNPFKKVVGVAGSSDLSNRPPLPHSTVNPTETVAHSSSPSGTTSSPQSAECEGMTPHSMPAGAEPGEVLSGQEMVPHLPLAHREISPDTLLSPPSSSMSPPPSPSQMRDKSREMEMPLSPMSNPDMDNI